MLEARVFPLNLKFIKPAGTSRGVLQLKMSWILVVKEFKTGALAYGEFSIIESLSPDWDSHYENHLKSIAESLKRLEDFELLKLKFQTKPSIVFGLETAQLDLKNGGRKEIFANDFFRSKKRIPINGLIWMNDKESMFKSIQAKLTEGFDCIKLKIGAIDYQSELELLTIIRSKFTKDQIEIRVDANGAFSYEEAQKVLKDLHKLEIHSIEQPVKQGQYEAMAKLCAETPTPIALDEELIGIHDLKNKAALLDQIKPQYIILKPSLHGGFKGSSEWIHLAEDRNIGWWITSALESNIGLNAICQFSSSFQTDKYQGLGTGSLYSNNFKSPLTVENGHIYYNSAETWEIPKAFSF